VAQAVAKVAAWQTPMRLNETTRTYFERLAGISTAEEASRYRALLGGDLAAVAAAQEHLALHEPRHHSMLRTSISPNIITGGYQAEYGRATGGVLNVVTKSGSNEFHGSVWGNWTPGLLTGVAPAIQNRSSVIQTQGRLWNTVDFGAEVGGPILKDRLWFFVGFAPSFNRSQTTRELYRFDDATTVDTTRTLLMAAIVGLLLWRCGLPRHRFLYAGGLALLAVTSLTMVCCRAEVGHCLDHYRTTFPDRYFYAQYLVGLPLLAAFTADLSARLAARPWLARLPWAGVFALAALAAWREPAWYVADSQFIVDDDGCFARAAAAAIDRGDFRAADRRPDHRGPFVAIPVHPAFQDAEVLLPRVPVERSVDRHGGTGGARLADRPDRPRR
jgi:hypothetical protein